MKSVIITPKSESELKFIAELLKKLGIDSKVMSVDEMEDTGLSLLMKEADRTKRVSRNAIMKKLNS